MIFSPPFFSFPTSKRLSGQNYLLGAVSLEKLVVLTPDMNLGCSRRLLAVPRPFWRSNNVLISSGQTVQLQVRAMLGPRNTGSTKERFPKVSCPRRELITLNLYSLDPPRQINNALSTVLIFVNKLSTV